MFFKHIQAGGGGPQSPSLDYKGTGSPDIQARKITGGYQVDPQDYHSYKSAVNYSILVVMAQIYTHKVNTYEAWDKITSAPIDSLWVTIWDSALDYSASTVSRNLALHNGEVQKQKEDEANKQHAVPGL